MIVLKPEPLTKAAFAPFGEVIEVDGAHHYGINQGFAERYHALARIDTASEDGTPIISVFIGEPRPLPLEIELMERHPLSSQAFYPLQERDWLVVVAEGAEAPQSLRAFRASGRQGVSYARNVWHHPLLVLDPASRFLIVDRKGPGENLEEHWFDEGVNIRLEL
ncbi:MAG TPA: ureidoglycolate lyase [Dongiaceae bacterium]|nr:ureidoglycolate lyase [Dongiaceae bacterium]